MAVCHTFIRKNVGSVLFVVLSQMLAVSLICFYAVENYTIQIHLTDNYVGFYKNNVELEDKVIQAKQPMQLIATLPCLSAQFYQVTVVSASLKLTKIMAVPYHGECRGKITAIKYGVQAVY